MFRTENNSISVGFGTDHHQSFFDTLQAYDYYIRDYFFGLHYNIGGIQYNHNELDRMAEMDTYEYPANLLFNQYHPLPQIISTISAVKDIVNLKHITVLDPSIADCIKRQFPDIEIQLSVRFWDWGRFKVPIARLPELAAYGIDVINISGKCSYNDFEFINRVHELGMLTKFITDEDCVIGGDLNYSRFPTFDSYMCRPNPFCSRSCSSGCFAIQKEYPWMELASNNLYKESMKYYPKIDILKISGRPRGMHYITYQLDYWTSEENTSRLLFHTRTIDLHDKYDVFLDWIEYKSLHCRGNCVNCQKCKYFWEEFTNELVK